MFLMIIITDNTLNHKSKCSTANHADTHFSQAERTAAFSRKKDKRISGRTWIWKETVSCSVHNRTIISCIRYMTIHVLFDRQEEELHSQQQKLEHSWVELEDEKKRLIGYCTVQIVMYIVVVCRQEEEFNSQQQKLEQSWVELEAEKKRLIGCFTVISCTLLLLFDRQEEEFYSQQRKLEQSLVELEAEKSRWGLLTLCTV